MGKQSFRVKDTIPGHLSQVIGADGQPVAWAMKHMARKVASAMNLWQAMEETDENGVSAETPIGNSHKEAGPACGSQAGTCAMEGVFVLIAGDQEFQRRMKVAVTEVVSKLQGKAS
jgi:hypothetical protein